MFGALLYIYVSNSARFINLIIHQPNISDYIRVICSRLDGYGQWLDQWSIASSVTERLNGRANSSNSHQDIVFCSSEPIRMPWLMLQTAGRVYLEYKFTLSSCGTRASLVS